MHRSDFRVETCLILVFVRIFMNVSLCCKVKSGKGRMREGVCGEIRRRHIAFLTTVCADNDDDHDDEE